MKAHEVEGKRLLDGVLVLSFEHEHKSAFNGRPVQKLGAVPVEGPMFLVNFVALLPPVDIMITQDMKLASAGRFWGHVHNVRGGRRLSLVSVTFIAILVGRRHSVVPRSIPALCRLHEFFQIVFVLQCRRPLKTNILS